MLRHPLMSIIFIALVIRIIIALLYGHATIYPDSEGYFELAQRLIDFNIEGYEGQRSPGYPILLAITNLNIPVVIVLQFLLGIISLILFYKTCLLLEVNKKRALLLTLAITLYIPIVFFELAILTETLTLSCISLAFYLIAKIIKCDEVTLKEHLLLAIVCASLVFIKPFYIFMAPLLAILIYISGKRIGASLLILFLPSIIFIGWSVVNKANTGHFTSTTFYGFNLAQNCVHFAENTSNEYQKIGDIYANYREANDTTDLEVAMTIWQAYPELQSKTGLSFPDLSKKLYDYSITTIKMNPTAYAKQVFISWRDFWKTSLYWEYDNFAVQGSNIIIKYICYAERIALQLIKIAFIFLIPVYTVRAVRSRKISFQLIAALSIFSASVLQAMMTYGTNSRFSFPFETIIVLIVALELYNKFNKQKS